jgi:UDP-N-acetylmuramoylalanine--D-glutamate ligase
MHDFRNKRVTLAGLGKFGGQIAAARWLVGQGARVLVTDKSPAEKLQSSIDQLAGLPIEFVLGEHRTRDFTDCDLIVTSPAVPPTNEFLQAAQSARVPVTLEIALFLDRCPCPVVAVTGTKGKSTTTALLHRMLATTFTAHLGGNIGKPLIEHLAAIRPDHLVVLELSSFMLHWLGQGKFAPHGAILTMIDADHLDWHGTTSAYHAAKAEIVRQQTARDFVVFDPLHANSLAIASRAASRQLPLVDEPIDLLLPGDHNRRNALLALRAAVELGVPAGIAKKSVADFPGLPHRLELVHEHAGVRWFNDSIATIPQAAIVAGTAFPRGTVLQIVGGAEKGLDFTAMCQHLSTHCRAVLTIGTVGTALHSKMKSLNGPATLVDCHTLDVAVARAHELAQPGDVVLLSTGCTSYDQFDHFEHRGHRFTELARQSG